MLCTGGGSLSCRDLFQTAYIGISCYHVFYMHVCARIFARKHTHIRIGSHTVAQGSGSRAKEYGVMFFGEWRKVIKGSVPTKTHVAHSRVLPFVSQAPTGLDPAAC